MELFTNKMSTVAEGIKNCNYPLDDVSHLDPLMERVVETRFMLLGEATHCTQEYYTWGLSIHPLYRRLAGK